MGWSEINVDKMSRLRIAKEDNIEIKDILKKGKKVIELEEIKKIKKSGKRKNKR